MYKLYVAQDSRFKSLGKFYYMKIYSTYKGAEQALNEYSKHEFFVNRRWMILNIKTKETSYY